MDETTKAFIDEIVEVCRKHNLTISHEDFHGAFLIEPFDENNIEWLRNAYTAEDVTRLARIVEPPKVTPG